MQAISRIVVDRDAQTIVVHFRKIPSTDPDFEDLLQKKGCLQTLQVPVVAGARIFPYLQTWSPPSRSQTELIKPFSRPRVNIILHSPIV
jgi:hypothetical protein